LWEANYSRSLENLPANNIWSSRAGHQYTDKGVVDGIYGGVDLNEFTQDIFR
jgi:GH25 family lysozyme M1 (1,4-beta-N-acetylmuramidase)